MGDGSAIGGWILTAAIVTVLAGGAAASSGSGGSGGSSGSSGSGRSGGSTPAITVARSTPATGTAAGNGPRPACARVVTRLSRDGKQYTRYPVTTGGAVGCGMAPGDTGASVTSLQRALQLCAGDAVAKGLAADGIYGRATRAALSLAQADMKSVRTDGVYDARTATRMTYPWYRNRSTTFSGLCSPAGTRVP